MKLNKEFFHRDCLEVAPELVGKIIVRKIGDEEIRLRITETEAYRGEEDGACHAHKGRTPRTEILYGESGLIYIYLIYGMHWLMNVITGDEGVPQGVLFRCCENYSGPGRLTKALSINKELNGKSFIENNEIWLEDEGFSPKIKTAPRVGIDYAEDEWRLKPWRFIAEI